MKKFRHIHFVGIGGIGMSGIARIMILMGYNVSGSDIKSNNLTSELEQLGCSIRIGHIAKNIEGADLVVVSAAIPEDNPELVRAREKGIPIKQRAEMLAYLMERRFGITVAGTHGKTTTTSMIGWLLENCGLDPTLVIGGELNDFGANAKLGRLPYFVAEADESDASFLNLNPRISVITGTDVDVNLNYKEFKKMNFDYHLIWNSVQDMFLEFIHCTHPEGKVIICTEKEYTKKLIPLIRRPFMTYGIGEGYTLKAENPVLSRLSSTFQVLLKDKLLGDVKLNVPGRHNVLNSLAAIAVGLELGLDFKQISGALSKFSGVQRRFQIIGEKCGIMVIDDYAHNPTKIKAALATAAGMGRNRIIAVFQPHRYTRTRLLLDQFRDTFDLADIVLVMPIYSAGEDPIKGIDSNYLANVIKQGSCKTEVRQVSSEEEVISIITSESRAGDLIITLGAGDVNLTARKISQSLANKTNGRELPLLHAV
ncbi:MAG: UDP-N-acetylmuramate--L-alanine ligase [Candidatus Eremiobacteraeota bacterium]|nr:UDP-N-acetylmuramate--L-alanine ligase [Candidatus Eremiobacteraeota bacterium]